jgi:hypothetical protein
MKVKLANKKTNFLMQPFQNPALCSSTAKIALLPTRCILDVCVERRGLAKYSNCLYFLVLSSAFRSTPTPTPSLCMYSRVHTRTLSATRDSLCQKSVKKIPQTFPIRLLRIFSYLTFNVTPSPYS